MIQQLIEQLINQQAATVRRRKARYADLHRQFEQRRTSRCPRRIGRAGPVTASAP